MIPEHEKIFEEIRALRNGIEPLIQITPKLTAMADIYTAGQVGGTFLKWTAAIGGIILATWTFIKAVAGTILGH